jgi:hypothetical protein
LKLTNYMRDAFVRAVMDDVPRWLETLEALVKKKDHDEELRADLHAKIKAVAYSVSTRKALADALPEFEKYLPADDAKAIRTLPVVANVVTDFMKAGWPKEQVA